MREANLFLKKKKPDWDTRLDAGFCQRRFQIVFFKLETHRKIYGLA